MDPAVEADGAGGLGEGFQQEMAETAGCFCHGKEIHPVRPGTENTTQATGSKDEIPVEAVIPFRFIHRPKIIQQFFIHGRAGEPFIIFLCHSHQRTSLIQNGAHICAPESSGNKTESDNTQLSG